MRHAALTALLLWVSRWAALAGPDPKPESDTEPAHAAQTLRIAAAAAEQYTLRSAEGDTPPLKLEPGPLLKFSNPVIGSAYGAVYLYTARGRPEAIVSIYKWYAPVRHMGVEFHSLSLGRITAEQAGRTVWYPARAGVELKPIPDAPAPAGSSGARLRQIRALADQFSAIQTNENGIARDLRLLTKPLYRYAGNDSNVPDGALFAFVQGTDPEAILLIEARPDEQGRLAWHYALARMTFRKLTVSLKGRAVWTVPVNSLGPNSEQQDRRATYTEFVFQPGEGLNPADETAVE